MSTESFIHVESCRDVLFVFGAGASIAEGAPLQRDILKLIFESEDQTLINSGAACEVREFISNNFDLSSAEYPSLESVFGYLDYFIGKNESLGGMYNTSKISSIKESLLKLIHHVIAQPTSSMNGSYRKFWSTIAEHNKNISVVTMNYDTLLDESFDFLYSRGGYIDYCLEFMNYHHYESIDAFHWWDNPRKPVTVWKEETPFSIKLIKAHGSLNWKYCNCCNQVLLTAWDTKIDLESMGFKGVIGACCGQPETIEYDLKCPLDQSAFQTFIVPPSHIKDLSHPAINKLLDEAAIEVRKAKKIVFVGYSFPEADVHIKALFKKNLRPETEIHVVDPFMNDAIRSNYKSISQSVNFYEVGFDEYVSGELVSLLTKAIA